MIVEQRLPQETKVVIDLERARQDFPALLQRPRGKPLVYLDNAATTLKPQAVVDAVGTYYTQECANVHRGVHYLSEQATHDYEKARERIQAFLNAAEPREIAFVRGTTEAINLVAQTFGRELGPRDEILISVMEHHSNMVPWQIVAAQTGALVKAVPVTEKGEPDMEALEALLGPRTRLVAITHMSNVLGTINPVAEIAKKARAWEPAYWWMAPRRRRACRSTCRPWTVTSTPFPGINSMGPPGLACCTARRSCWRPCHHTRAAER